MDIVILAAGTSSRMGKINKLILPINGMTMVAHCALQALSFLESLNEKSKLIVVTGYRNRSTVKALQPCKDFIEKTDAHLELIIVKNENYRKGQFNSTKIGVEQVSDHTPFFISLADMPDINASHYKTILKELKTNDAVRPFFKDQPGHPVLLSNRLKNAILRAPDNKRVADILSNYRVINFQIDDASIIHDIDTPQEI